MDGSSRNADTSFTTAAPTSIAALATDAFTVSIEMTSSG
jgi:hypothetical protein